VQRGHDPRDYALYAYGGAGPAIAALAAEELKIGRVVVPPHPGLFSAVGLLAADLRRVYRETDIMALTADATARVSEAFARLRAAAEREFSGYGLPLDRVGVETALEMRYAGQGFELLVPVDLARVAAEGRDYLLALFHAAHRARYGTQAPTDRIEIVTFRLMAQAPGDDDVLARTAPTADASAPPGAATGEIVFGGRPVGCRFVDRRTLGPGARVEGCCVVEEPTATTLVPPGWTATVGEAGALILLAEDGR
jgi:N-methylhydantoinase A